MRRRRQRMPVRNGILILQINVYLFDRIHYFIVVHGVAS